MSDYRNQFFEASNEPFYTAIRQEVNGNVSYTAATDPEAAAKIGQIFNQGPGDKLTQVAEAGADNAANTTAPIMGATMEV